MTAVLADGNGVHNRFACIYVESTLFLATKENFCNPSKDSNYWL